MSFLTFGSIIALCALIVFERIYARASNKRNKEIGDSLNHLTRCLKAKNLRLERKIRKEKIIG